MAFASVFLFAGPWQLAVVNAACLLASGVAMRSLGREHVARAFAIGAITVVVDGALQTLYVGVQSGFFVYIPLLAVLVFLYPGTAVRSKAAWSAALALVLVGVIAAAEEVPPLAPVSVPLVRTFAVLNTLCLMASLSYLSYLVASAADTAERELRAALERVDALARTDPLTGLLNRRAMSELLDAEEKRFARTGRPFSVLVADLDDFKDINDAHGHEVGDHALRSVAQRLLAAVRAQDRVARWGGEEFLVLLPETDGPLAELAAKRLLSRLSEAPIVMDGLELAVACTVGVAAYARGSTVRDVVREADRAMYRGKAEGKHRVERGA